MAQNAGWWYMNELTAPPALPTFPQRRTEEPRGSQKSLYIWMTWAENVAIVSETLEAARDAWSNIARLVPRSEEAVGGDPTYIFHLADGHDYQDQVIVFPRE